MFTPKYIGTLVVAEGLTATLILVRAPLAPGVLAAEPESPEELAHPVIRRAAAASIAAAAEIRCFIGSPFHKWCCAVW
ncbi:hypothetical protein GCM10011399_02190 [Subtercola lobariae]|uniref:Uncharacterized protein n=1 Tax=Subtercola lobariae TaxID=1588641 RepID=A0A917EU01_9MICO|nr:hypothetical protein GCM10011399_02190 [Subtercola lobariae]